MPINLTGRIFREEGMFIAELHELGQSTWAHTLPEVMADAPRLAVSYLDSLRVLGLFDETIARLGGAVTDGKVDISLHFTIDPDVLPPAGVAESNVVNVFESSTSLAVAA